MRNVVHLCLAANNILLMRKRTTLLSFCDRSCVKRGRSLRFPKIVVKKQTWWSNDKTIIKLGYRKISRFASVSNINYLPKPKAEANNWSARHWQTHDILLNLVQ